MIAAELADLLRKRYPGPEWACFTQVGSETGYGTRRHADMVALNTWPSRGLALHGFEIKVSRSDWLRELKNPAKADPIAGYCDRWWVVASNLNVVTKEELPAEWGLLVPSRADKLAVVVDAPQREHVKSLDKPFVAAVLRRAATTLPGDDAIDAAYERGRAAAQREIEEDKQRAIEAARAMESRLDSKIRRFEEASGIKLDGYEGPEELGRMVRELTHMEHLTKRLQRLREDARDITTRLDQIQLGS